jgi:8-amino-7-oxononanoate synthase
VSSTAQHISYDSPIIPYILGDNARALAKAQQLQAAGFYALPIRPPTVPENTARIRLVMNAKLTNEDCERLIQQL